MTSTDGPLSRETEPGYRELLEADRANFPTEEQFRHWKRHFASEVDRGRFIIGTLQDYLPDLALGDLRILDIGCGDAGVPIAFASAGARATGLEPGRVNLRRGRVRADDHRVAVDLLAGVAEALPFADDSFDLVILDNVLEHVRDRAQTLTEIRRALSPGGILYLVTPKPYALASLLGDPHYHLPGLVLLPVKWQRWVVEHRLGPGSYDVGRIPTRRWARRALRRHGFEVLVPPRDLWVRYLRDRISRPEEVRPGVKRRLAAWLTAHPRFFRNPVIRWLLDVGLGSNFFLARYR